MSESSTVAAIISALATLSVAFLVIAASGGRVKKEYLKETKDKMHDYFSMYSASRRILKEEINEAERKTRGMMVAHDRLQDYYAESKVKMNEMIAYGEKLKLEANVIEHIFSSKSEGKKFYVKRKAMLENIAKSYDVSNDKEALEAEIDLQIMCRYINKELRKRSSIEYIFALGILFISLMLVFVRVF